MFFLKNKTFNKFKQNVFSIFGVWTPDLAISDFNFRFYASKSTPRTPPEAWKPEIDLEHEKFLF